ncbi:2TM domain-containing protein [Celerinatantimonas diazotrophica]|uniref:Helix-turn-helix protein n=1 Tax=Celerinatantimonas diazotrophica TaxID=412034 RepID=A0A4V2PNJ8_9GAMM|nr:2TM domain-containing protein [Celerinatantimonas diazotrophica]TCK47341.1 helix-turn-helix protein [Celerinatantimonas diazotrophica]CAG9295043.1 hypothetical protein CEDIAZO_00149 [Celerinatantimonas diazotrophica]
MEIRTLRLKRGWSQEQLSLLSGLSVRTIQRIERGQKPSLESLKSLAAVFEIDIQELSLLRDSDERNEPQVSEREQEQLILHQVREMKRFYSHLISYIVVVVFLFIINIVTDPSYIWAYWAALGLGIGIIKHALRVFHVFHWFGAEWEKKQVEKRLGRKP